MTMKNAICMSFFGLLFETSATNSWADPRCDCAYNKIQGTCTAAIERKQDWVEISTPTVSQCTSVVWEINGFPQVSTVTDGHLSEPLINVSSVAKIDVRSCKICKDANYPNATSNGSNGNPSQQPVSTSTKSVFDGTWTGSQKTFIGASHAMTVVLNVSGSSATGTWLNDDSPMYHFHGTATATSVDIRWDDVAASGASFQLIDADTLKWSWGLGGGTLKRAQ